jgi:Cation transporter/ATPase, N-terminus
LSVETREPVAIPAGLTSREARRRPEAFGPNAVAEECRSLWRTLLEKFWSPCPGCWRPRSLMAPLPWHLVAATLAAATGFAVILDPLKRPILSVLRVA